MKTNKTGLIKAVGGSSNSLSRLTIFLSSIGLIVLMASINYAYHRASAVPDTTPPTITVSSGSSSNSFKAIDNEPATTWNYAFISSADTCDNNVSFSSSYTEGNDVNYTDSNNTQRICFNSTDEANNSSYAVSDVIETDTTPPTVTVTSSTNSFKATDNEDGTTWQYGFIAANTTCGATATFSPYTEGNLISYTDSNHNQRICFSSTDTASNTGYQASDVINVVEEDTTTPTITVSSGSSPNSFKATDNEDGTIWHHVFIDQDDTCNNALTFSPYTEGNDVSYTDSNNNQRVCFRSADTASNTSYQASDVINIVEEVITPLEATVEEDIVPDVPKETVDTDNEASQQAPAVVAIDITPPTITVSSGSSPNSFKATDDEDGTTWQHALITSDATCGDEVSFSDYTEGNDVNYTDSNNTQRICFNSTDEANNSSYATSSVIETDTTPPTITIEDGTATNTFKATDNEDGTTWQHALIAGDATCGDEVSFSDYTEGTDVNYTDSNNNQRVCFSSADTEDNVAYATSDVIETDTTPPTITIEDGTATNSFKAIDNEEGTIWHHVFIAQANACDNSLTFSEYTEGNDVSYNHRNNNQRVCFRSADTSDNVTYASSATIDVAVPPPRVLKSTKGLKPPPRLPRQSPPDTTAPTIRVEEGSTTNTFKATDLDHDTDSPTDWLHVLIFDGVICGDSIPAFSGYTEGEDVNYDDSHNGQRVCFNSTDEANNTSYATSDVIDTDTTGPTITIKPGTISNTFKATDNEEGTTWHFAFTTDDDDDCETTIGYTASYDEGSNIQYAAGQNGKRLCFRSTDTFGNHGYATSDVIAYVADTTPPTITVTTGSVPNSFKARDNEDGPWLYGFIAGDAACTSTTSTPIGYREGSDVIYNILLNGQKVCFKSRDLTGNVATKASAIIRVADTTPPNITIEPGFAPNSFRATDDEPDNRTWRYQFIPDFDCSRYVTFRNDYREGDDVVYDSSHNGQKLCFRSEDRSGNFGYSRTSSLSAVPNPPANIINLLPPRFNRNVCVPLFDFCYIATRSEPTGLHAVGTTMYVVDTFGRRVLAYDMNNFNLEPTVFMSSELEQAGNYSPGAIYSDGTDLYITDSDRGRIYNYRISDKHYNKSKSLRLRPNGSYFGRLAPYGLWSNGTKIWVTNAVADDIYALNLSSKRFSNGNFGPNNVAINRIIDDRGAPRGLWSDDTTLWLAVPGVSELLAFSLASGEPTPDENIALNRANTDPVDLYADSTHMWVLDRQSQSIFKYEL